MKTPPRMNLKKKQLCRSAFGGLAGQAFRPDQVKTIIRPVYLPISGIQSEWHTVCIQIRPIVSWI